MITYNSEPVRIIAGDHRDRLATIEWPDGKVRVVRLEKLRGTRTLEVVMTWQSACKQTKNQETR